MLDQWPALQIRLMNPNPSTHGDMGWGYASLVCHPKVMTRSSQGQSKVKSA